MRFVSASFGKKHKKGMKVCKGGYCLCGCYGVPCVCSVVCRLSDVIYFGEECMSREHAKVLVMDAVGQGIIFRRRYFFSSKYMSDSNFNGTMGGECTDGRPDRK